MESMSRKINPIMKIQDIVNSVILLNRQKLVQMINHFKAKEDSSHQTADDK
jgi:hypothetical protein